MSSDTTVWTTPSPERMSIADTAKALTEAMATALRLFTSPTTPHTERDLLVDMWTQCWPTHACGFNDTPNHTYPSPNHTYSREGELTVSTVIVVRTRFNDQMVVFIAGKLAYHVRVPSSLFYAAYAGRSLAGADDWKKVSRYEMQPR